MSFELFCKIIDELSVKPETVLVLHRRGESMLHPKFCEMINFVAGKFKEVQMATNATVLSEDKFEALVNGVDFLSFSLDTPNNFNKTRVPANYERVEKKILSFLDYNKGRVKTQASMVKTENTPEGECELFISIWSDRVDWVRIYEAHSEDGNFGSLKIPRTPRKPCVMPIYDMLVYDDGRVARCNHDWDSDGMGDLNLNTIQEIWHNDKYKELRRQHMNVGECSISDAVCSKCDSWYPEIGNQGTGGVVELGDKK
jgi:radical SAM protein with 4Fe4S-binding SPASM domain